MLVDSKHFLRQELPGISFFHSKECQVSNRLTWKLLRSPAFVHSFDLGLKRWDSQVIIRQQGILAPVDVISDLLIFRCQQLVEIFPTIM